MNPSADSRAPKPRSHAVVRAVWMTAALAVAVVWLGAGFFYLSGSSIVCSGCHEMRPQVDTWKTSAHADIQCPSCHQAPQPTYRLPDMLGFRAAMMQRDLRAHFAGGSTAVAMPVASSTAPTTIPDSTCLRCHDMSRQITVHSDLLINHAEHAARNKSCVSCHLWTAHPVPDAERPMLLMERCFTCHGSSSTAKAPGTCNTCHSKDFNGRPQSHTAGNWQAVHGKAALSNLQPCSMCHEPAFCRDCHGLEMPHPADWVKGNPGHSTVGKASPQICAKCHTQKPDLCSMCHHRDYDPDGRPWVSQHPTMVANRGAAFCMTCHTPVFCYDCHTARHIVGPAAQ